MAIVRFINRGKRNLKEVLSYVASNDRVCPRDGNSPTFIGGISDNPKDANVRMEVVKRLWHKTGGRTYIHFVISPKDGNAEEMEMFSKYIIKEFSNFACFYGVHQNTKHVHAHYILNSVGFDGKKFTQSKQDLKSFKNAIDHIWHDIISYEDIEFDSSWDDYEEYEEYDPDYDYSEDTDGEEQHIYWLGTAFGYIDISYRPHRDDDYRPVIYRNINGSYYPVLPADTDGKTMVIKVNKTTDIKPMVTYVDKDGYLTLD